MDEYDDGFDSAESFERAECDTQESLDQDYWASDDRWVEVAADLDTL